MKLSSCVVSLTLLSATQASTRSSLHTDFKKNVMANYRERVSDYKHQSPSDSLRSLLAKNAFRQLQDGEVEEGSNALNCNDKDVSDWVTENVQGGRCGDFADVIGGVELCQQYEGYDDPVQCFDLDDTPSFNVGGGGMGPSPLEECLFFLDHLLPHPYFMDLDSILPVFGSDFDYPTQYQCTASLEHDCPVEIRYEQEYPDDVMAEFSFLNLTAAPTPAPMRATVPCTRCDYEYDSDDVCFEAPCEYFDCEENLDAPEVNRTVQVCFENSRSDLFGFTEHRIGAYYGCSITTQEKHWTTTFHKGVTNIQLMEFRLGERGLTAGDKDSQQATSKTDDGLIDYCELIVDGVTCNGCNFCGVNDTNPHMAMDCDNVAPGAITSCDDELDFIFGIARKLIHLQDGHTRAPTSSPNVQVPSPSSTTTSNNNDAMMEQQSDSTNGGELIQGELDADQFVDTSSSAMVVRVGAAVVAAVLFGFL